MGLYLALVIGVRVAIAVRRTGKTGIVSPRGAPPLQRVGNLVLLLGLVLGSLNVLLAALDVIEPWSSWDSTAVHVAGFVLCAIGIAGTFAAQMAMGDSWRVGIDRDERTDLVTGGMFRLSRNPGYSFMVIAAVGFTLLVPTWLAVVAAVLLIAGVLIQVRLLEEPHLKTAHGDTYAAYAGRTGRFLPGVGRLR